jgi:hypothetical protein
MSILERYAKKWTPITETGCYVWTGAITSQGRPYVKLGIKNLRLNRVVCEEAHGPPPTSQHQSAHNTPNGCIGDFCIAPHHLRWATPRENQQDIPAEKRRARAVLARINRSSESRGPRRERYDAIVAGLATYFRNKPCKNGHSGPYRVKSGCIQCQNERNARRGPK